MGVARYQSQTHIHTHVPNKVRYLTSQHLEGYLLMGNIIVCIANILMYRVLYVNFAARAILGRKRK